MSVKKFTYEKKSGTHFPFLTDKNGNLKSLEDSISAINQNLILFFKTERGSRVMRPTLGLRLRKRLGEPLSEDVRNDLASKVEEQINEYFPRINILEIILEQPSELSFDLIIKYKIKNNINQISPNTVKIKIQ